MNSLNVEIQNPFKVRDDFDLKFANAIEKCRANIQSKVTELVTSYNESNKRKKLRRKPYTYHKNFYSSNNKFCESI